MDFSEETHVNNRSFRSSACLRSALTLSALIPCLLGGITAAHASNLLGVYVGAAYGQAHVRADLGRLLPPGSGSLPGFDATHSAFQAMLGIRVLSFLGAEATYMDFGQPSTIGGPPGQLQLTSAKVSQKGEAAYALLYLPVPVIDVYIKGGLSRITTDASATYALVGAGTCQTGNPNCNVLVASGSSSHTAFAYGAGVQWKLGSWAVRGEYERFDAAGANPSLFSIGMTYWL